MSAVVRSRRSCVSCREEQEKLCRLCSEEQKFCQLYDEEQKKSCQLS